MRRLSRIRSVSRGLALALLVAGAAIPVPASAWEDMRSSNACREFFDDNAGTLCLVVTVTPPWTPAPSPVGPGTYYVFVPVGPCLDHPLGYDCRQHRRPDSGVALPTGDRVCPCAIGVLWEEADDMPGLQTQPIIYNGHNRVDRMLLV